MCFALSRHVTVQLHFDHIENEFLLRFFFFFFYCSRCKLVPSNSRAFWRQELMWDHLEAFLSEIYNISQVLPSFLQGHVEAIWAQLTIVTINLKFEDFTEFIWKGYTYVFKSIDYRNLQFCPSVPPNADFSNVFKRVFDSNTKSITTSGPHVWATWPGEGAWDHDSIWLQHALTTLRLPAAPTRPWAEGPANFYALTMCRGSNVFCALPSCDRSYELCCKWIPIDDDGRLQDSDESFTSTSQTLVMSDSHSGKHSELILFWCIRYDIHRPDAAAVLSAFADALLFNDDDLCCAPAIALCSKVDGFGCLVVPRNGAIAAAVTEAGGKIEEDLPSQWPSPNLR